MVGASPHLFRPTYPDFLHGAPPTTACAAFIKESRMKLVNAGKLDRKFRCTPQRTWGTRDFSAWNYGTAKGRSSAAKATLFAKGSRTA